MILSGSVYSFFCLVCQFFREKKQIHKVRSNDIGGRRHVSGIHAILESFCVVPDIMPIIIMVIFAFRKQ